MKEVDDNGTPQPEEPPPSYEDSINVDDHQDLPPPQEIETSMMEGDDEREGNFEDEGISVERLSPPGDVTSSSNNQPPRMDRSIEFPLTHYYELEGRVHTDQWSIPYKKEESLGVCMLATIDMMREGES